MEIKNNTIYHIPSMEHEDDFLKQANKQGLTWWDKTMATRQRNWDNESYCVRVESNCLAGYCSTHYYKTSYTHLPKLEWKKCFTKSDMQVGQLYLQANGYIHKWREEEKNYSDELTFIHDDIASPEYDIIEVYPMEITPVWKREQEPKYRVNVELTKEQAERLGIELCELVIKHEEE